MGYNLNYPEYGSYMPAPSYTPQTPMVPQGGDMLGTLGKVADIASPVVSLAGIGLGAYGAYKQNQQMEKQYELQRKMWEAEQNRIREQEARQQRQLELDNALKYGNYAQGEEDRALASYGNYASRVGL